jgi:hypothetical protein
VQGPAGVSLNVIGPGSRLVFSGFGGEIVLSLTFIIKNGLVTASHFSLSVFDNQKEVIDVDTDTNRSLLDKTEGLGAI